MGYEYRSREGEDAFTEDYYREYESGMSLGDARIPIVIVVDTSQSMNIIVNDPSEVVRCAGTDRQQDGLSVYTVRAKPGYTLKSRLDACREVFREMLVRMQKDQTLRKTASVCIISFDKFADCLQDFLTVSSIDSSITRDLKLGAPQTRAAVGLSRGLERLDRQQEMMAEFGNDSYKPVLIFMSDGNPTDRAEAYRMQGEVRKRSEEGTLNVIPVAIGRDLDESFLRGLTGDGRVYHMTTEREFREVFSLISQKIRTTTALMPADEDTGNMAEHADTTVPSTEYGSDFSMDLDDFLNS